MGRASLPPGLVRLSVGEEPAWLLEAENLLAESMGATKLVGPEPGGELSTERGTEAAVGAHWGADTHAARLPVAAEHPVSTRCPPHTIRTIPTVAVTTRGCSMAVRWTAAEALSRPEVRAGVGGSG